MIVVAAFARHRGTLMLDGETGPTLCNRARTFADRNIPDLSDIPGRTANIVGTNVV